MTEPLSPAIEKLSLAFSPVVPDWVVMVLSGVLALVLVFYSRRVARTVRAARSLALTALRLVFFLGLLAVVLRPAMVLSRMRAVQGTLVVAVDRSASMALRASAADPSGSGERPQARADWVRRWVSDSVFRAQLSAYRVRFVAFGSEAVEIPELAPDVLEPGEETTRLSDALDLIGTWSQTENVTGVLLFTDGVDRSGLRERLERDDRPLALERAPVPVTAIGFPRPSRVRDLSIEDVEAQEFAFVRTGIRVKARLKARGLDLDAVPVTLRREGEVYSAQSAALDRSGEAEVVFELQPAEVGEAVYSVSVPVYEGEAASENNERAFVLRVLRDKTRILLISGRPSWELRFFRELIKRHPHYDLVNFNILRTPSDVFAVPERELSLIPFPSEELFSKDIKDFDLLVLLDFTPQALPTFPPYISAAGLQKIRERVSDAGLGLLIVGGEQTFSGAVLHGSPLYDLLPVEVPMLSRGFDPGPFSPAITPTGASHFILSAEGAEAPDWSSLPPLLGSATIGPLREGAMALLAHPVLKAGGQAVPVVALWEKGKGRVMLTSTDTFWRWGFPPPEKTDAVAAYHQFWYRAIRWLTQDPQTRRIAVSFDRKGPHRFTAAVRVSDRSYRPARGAQVEIVVDDLHGHRVTEPASETGEGTYEASLSLPAAEVYRVSARAHRGEVELGETETVFTDASSRAELRDHLPDQTLLDQLARRTGGRFVDITTTLPADLRWPPTEAYVQEGSQHLPVWNTVYSLLAMVVAAAAEWTLRRRWGLM
ncbi:MAG: hypothetical protein HYY13_04550 [Nitrospirae bacterium]|nr:hypothetical protein [Nitrospirota bacterium]